MSKRVLNQMREGHILDNTIFPQTRWDEVDCSDHTTHLMPMYGRKHRRDKSCWCAPTIYANDNNDQLPLVLHNVEM